MSSFSGVTYGDISPRVGIYAVVSSRPMPSLS